MSQTNHEWRRVTPRGPSLEWIESVEARLAPEPDIMTADEVCRAMRFSRRTLNRFLSLGRLKATSHEDGGSARLLFAKAEIRRYLVALCGDV